MAENDADLGWVSLPTEEFERLARGSRENAELRLRLAEAEVENDQWQKKLAEVWAEQERLKQRIERLTRALSHS